MKHSSNSRIDALVSEQAAGVVRAPGGERSVAARAPRVPGLVENIGASMSKPCSISIGITAMAARRS